MAPLGASLPRFAREHRDDERTRAGEKVRDDGAHPEFRKRRLKSCISPFVPAQAGTQNQRLDSRWSLCSGQPKAGPEYGNERISEGNFARSSYRPATEE